jgi:hypothetical protein
MSLIFPLVLQVVGTPRWLMLLWSPPFVVFDYCQVWEGVAFLLVVIIWLLWSLQSSWSLSLLRWSRACFYSHSYHLELLIASPSFASQPCLGGGCEE